jgi:hypothetical protein
MEFSCQLDQLGARHQGGSKGEICLAIITIHRVGPQGSSVIERSRLHLRRVLVKCIARVCACT